MDSIGYGYYFMFIVCNFTNAIFFWLFLPETSCKSLEEMEDVFDSPLIVVGRASKTRRSTMHRSIQRPHKSDENAVFVEDTLVT